MHWEMEGDMTVNTGSSLDQTYGCSERGHLNQAVSEWWWNRLRLRRELESLDDTMLRDIGLYCEVQPEARKPFWMN
jgi:uncharacterized protein YjiS (DUF1127 family)